MPETKLGRPLSHDEDGVKMNDGESGAPAEAGSGTRNRESLPNGEADGAQGARYLERLAVEAIERQKGTFQGYRAALQKGLALEQKNMQGMGGMDSLRRVHEYEIAIAKLDNEQALFSRDEQVGSVRRFEDRLDRAQQTKLLEQQATVLESQASTMKHANTIQEGSAKNQAEFLDRQTRLMAETNRIYSGVKWLTVVVAFATLLQALFAALQYVK